ncbi:MAG: signal peptidase II [Acidobacteria bacterium]|nr:signal peptidase II [Acidobacteriota bacterium]MCI0628194.1 signal peptidase II [Acidobacteriota bacterium]MCI0722169.1 signal peptidase II [Acidobacteriota bacterium]
MTRSLYFVIPIVVFILDRLTKVLIESRFLLYESRPVISGVFDLTHTRNTGVAFGFLANSNSPWVPHILTLASATALIAILVYALRHPVQNWKLQLGLMLVLGGAAGNLYDRVSYGYVIDFLDVFYGTYHWPTFNVADSAITVGIGLLLLEVLFQKPHVEEVKTVAAGQ